MPKARNMEDLKSKIAKAQNKTMEAHSIPVPETPSHASVPMPKLKSEEKSLEELERQLSEMKEKIRQEAMQKEQEQNEEKPEDKSEDESEDDEPLTREQQIAIAVEEYQNVGKFRVELISQMVMMNQSLLNLSNKIDRLTEK